jgi:arginine exporter protein ArgO
MQHFLSLVYETIKVFIFFVGFTLLFYYGIVWLNEEYEGYNKYDKPQGGAVKVMEEEESKPVFSLKRLYFYYHYGE